MKLIASNVGVNITASDGNTSTTEQLILNVNDIDEAPELQSGISGTVAENLPTSTAIYTASAIDQDEGHAENMDFSITSNADDDSADVSIDEDTGVVTLVDLMIMKLNLIRLKLWQRILEV